MVEALYAFDYAILGFFSKLWNPILDVIMTFITRLGDKGLIWIALAIILLCTKKFRKAGFAMILALLGSMIINDNILKPLVERPRPYLNDLRPLTYVWPELIAKEGSFSFPSGHTTSSMGAAFALFQYDKKKLGISFLVLAILISISRLYVQVHYPTDVLFGMLEGLLLGMGAAYIVNKLYPKAEEWWKKRANSKAIPADDSAE